MGRTNPTFRNVLEAVKSRWSDYRRALRRRDKARFDRLFEYADAHADAAGYLNHDDPMEPILVSMLLEQEKRIAELEGRIDEMEGAEAATAAATDTATAAVADTGSAAATDTGSAIEDGAGPATDGGGG